MNSIVVFLFKLIDLKAELVRKQEEFKRKKLEKAAGGGSKQQKLVDKVSLNRSNSDCY